MSSEKDNMIYALKKIVIPELRNKGFKGSFPHFRRNSERCIELMTFQFDKYGGGFVIEIGVCSSDGLTHHWSNKVPANKETVYDLHPDKRKRLKNGNEEWFRYDGLNLFGNIYEKVANKVLKCLPEAEAYWDNSNP
jgi:hypothetical protein